MHFWMPINLDYYLPSSRPSEPKYKGKVIKFTFKLLISLEQHSHSNKNQ